MWGLWLGLALASPVDNVQAQLSARHEVACEDLGDGPEVRDAMIAVADTVEHPPWAATRAAACLARRAEGDRVAVEALERWAGDIERPGLAVVVAERLDDLGSGEAERLASLLVERFADDVRVARYLAPKLERSVHADVRKHASQLRRSIEAVR